MKEFDLEARASLDGEIVEKTIQFITEQARAGAPFFVYAALTQIHPPFLPSIEFAGKSGAGVYADIQMQVDAYVGKIVRAVDATGVAENTIVILTGDNAAGESSASWGGKGGSNGPWRGGLSTGYEGGVRTPGMIRWSGKIKPGENSDEIFPDLDRFPTLAHLISEANRIPNDRPIDGINQVGFLLGKQKESNREHIVTYVGNRVFSVKWRTLKVHFYTSEGTFSPIIEHTFPQVFDIKSDPGETRELWSQEGYAHLWVMKPIMNILGGLTTSMKEYPNIKPGQDFGGY